MKRLMLLVLVVIALATPAFAQAPAQPTLYIEPSNEGFETFITAAIFKKKVPIQVTTDAENATFTMKMTPIEVKKESGAGKIARCIFAYCAGISDQANISVTLVSKEGIVAWSYSVKKGKGGGNRQSMAEAIAKNLHNKFLKNRR